MSASDNEACEEAVKAYLERLLERIEEGSPAALPGLDLGLAQAADMLINDLRAYGADLDRMGIEGLDPLRKLRAKKAA